MEVEEPKLKDVQTQWDKSCTSVARNPFKALLHTDTLSSPYWLTSFHLSLVGPEPFAFVQWQLSARPYWSASDDCDEAQAQLAPGIPYREVQCLSKRCQQNISVLDWRNGETNEELHPMTAKGDNSWNIAPMFQRTLSWHKLHNWQRRTEDWTGHLLVWCAVTL